MSGSGLQLHTNITIILWVMLWNILKKFLTSFIIDSFNLTL
jgi:hypothetical protein